MAANQPSPDLGPLADGLCDQFTVLVSPNPPPQVTYLDDLAMRMLLKRVPESNESLYRKDSGTLIPKRRGIFRHS
jgi:hypothetical protein